MRRFEPFSVGFFLKPRPGQFGALASVHSRGCHCGLLCRHLSIRQRQGRWQSFAVLSAMPAFTKNAQDIGKTISRVVVVGESKQATRILWPLPENAC